MACVQLADAVGDIAIEEPLNPISSLTEGFWVPPCWFKTLPVLALCCTVEHRLTLLPLLLTSTEGKLLSLCMPSVSNSWVAAGRLIAGMLLANLLLPSVLLAFPIAAASMPASG